MACPDPNDHGPVAALDPGRSKCGLVRSDAGRRTLQDALILPPEVCGDTLLHWHRYQALSAVVLGDGTGSGSWQRQLQDAGIPVLLRSEWGTTLDARRRFWQQWPPQGWHRLIPEGLRLPPRDLDDVAAQILLEGWLQRPLPRCGQALTVIRSERER